MREEDTLDNTKVDMLRVKKPFLWKYLIDNNDGNHIL